jgi:beta-ureidopropionase / N-carbamoyl-L-amino-acid hydrolase
MKASNLRINEARLMARLAELAAIGATADGSCCRLALTDEDKAGRDLVVRWMRELGLEVRVDAIGNIFGRRRGSDEDAEPVMSGSHIDTVRTGGRYDGNLGVLGALEVVQVLNEAGIATRRPLVVGVFTDEEGARFHPDMLGSLVYAGGLPLAQAYATVGIDGKVLQEELARIGYLGDAPLPLYRPHAFVELHIEQGPVLDIEGVTIGAVESLQGISWQEVSISGQSNHAGTTPMRLRHDAGYCAAAIGHFLRASRGHGRQPGRDDGQGRPAPQPDQRDRRPRQGHRRPAQHRRGAAAQAESRLAQFLAQLAADEGVTIEASRWPASSR